MPTFSNKTMAARYRQRAAALNANVLQAEEASLRDYKEVLIRYSSGGMKTAQQRQLARQVNQGRGLYSVASPMPPTSPAFINLQTGRLARSWQGKVNIEPLGSSISVWNTAPYARYLATGTRVAIMRPILQAASAAMVNRRRARLLAALRATTQKN